MIGQEPIFVVGCSRGGTTLLHGVISNVESVAAFPESNVLYQFMEDLNFRRYGDLIGRKKKLLQNIASLINRAGLTPRFPRKELDKFRITVNSVITPKRNSILVKDIFEEFHDVMDEASGGRRWVEKSPQNIFCIDYIERYIPSAVFVHIVRDGRDTVGSLVDAATKYDTFSERFHGKRRIQKIVAYWNSSLICSFRCIQKENHVVVRYEDLISDPTRALSPVSLLTGLELKEKLVSTANDSIVIAREAWKEGYGDGFTPQQSKFRQSLTSVEQTWAIEHLLNADEYFPRFAVQKPTHE